MTPATRDDFRRELTACLALVAPIGMQEEDRNEWLRVAWATLDGIPGDLLSMGCAAVRKSADHHAKVVPLILSATEDLWTKRKRDKSAVADALAKMREAPAEAPEPRCTPEEAAAIIAQVGLKMDATKPDTSHRGKPIAPDAEWYRAHGVEIEATTEKAA